jgi:hypothetical protein
MDQSPETSTPPAALHPPTERGPVAPAAPPQSKAVTGLLLSAIVFVAVFALLKSNAISGPNFLIMFGSLFVWATMVLFSGTRTIALAPIMIVIAPFLLRNQVIDLSRKAEVAGEIPEAADATLREQLREIQDDFLRNGFTPTGVWRTGSAVLNGTITTYALTFSRPQTACASIAVFTMNDRGKMQGKPLISLHSRSAAGEDISTTNSQYMSVYPRDRTLRLRLPDVTEVAELLDVHEAMLRKFAPGGRHVNPAATGWAAYFNASNDADLARWCKGTSSRSRRRGSSAQLGKAHSAPRW